MDKILADLADCTRNAKILTAKMKLSCVCLSALASIRQNINRQNLFFANSPKFCPPLKISRYTVILLGRHGSVFLCRVERENKMAATSNVLAFKR